MVFFALSVFILSSFKVYAQAVVPPSRWDDRILIDIAKTRTPERTDFYRFMTNTQLYGDIGVPVGLFIGGVASDNKQMRENSVYVASSTAVSYGLMLLIKHLVKRPRPFIRNIEFVPVYRAGSTSFPSGHTASTFSTATALSLAYPKWYVIAPSYLWAGTIAYSRMYLGVHYPTDVAGGIGLGAGTALSLWPLRNAIVNKDH